MGTPLPSPANVMSNDRDELLRIYREACARLDARRLATEAAATLPPGCHVLGLGKVAHAQVRAVLAARPDLVAVASISTSRGPESWAVPGSHPIPDESSFTAGEMLLMAANDADGQPIALFLSGGASALAEVAWPGVNEDELVDASRRLLASGLDIGRMNVVRRRLSALKGGGLARAAPKGDWFVFALSDVVGDDLATIGSGPCTADPSRPGDAERICLESGLLASLGPTVRTRLTDRTVAPPLDASRITSRVLAGPRHLAFAANAVAPVHAAVLAPVTDDVVALADRYEAWARDRAGSGPHLLVAAGEPTLKVQGSGRGGRAQHLALLMADRLAGLDATFLAAGSDGRDGETDHAGAIVDGLTASRAGDRLARALEGFDSATLHASIGTAIERWDPVTHLGELHLLLVR